MLPITRAGHAFPLCLDVLAGQMCLFKHSEHFGATGRQSCWPNPTNSQLVSLHRSLGMGRAGEDCIRRVRRRDQGLEGKQEHRNLRSRVGSRRGSVRLGEVRREGRGVAQGPVVVQSYSIRM